MKVTPIKFVKRTYSQAQTTETKPSKNKGNKCTLICTLDSVLIKKSLESTIHVLNVKNAEGEIISVHWVNEDNTIPEVGSVLYVEYIMQETNNKSEMLLDIKISDLLVLISSYDLSYLQVLFKHAEQPKDLVRLLQFIERLHDERIKKFLIEIFQKPDIAVPFITLPASHNHHHSYPGGLLEHSIECVEWLETMIYLKLSTCEAELTLVTALLHDLGKIETMNPASQRQLVPHETLSLLLCEPFLMKLQCGWLQGADALRAMLSFSMSNNKFPKYPGLLLVKMSDQFSTSVCARNMAFADVPDNFYYGRLQTPTTTHFFNRLTVH